MCWALRCGGGGHGLRGGGVGGGAGCSGGGRGGDGKFEAKGRIGGFWGSTFWLPGFGLVVVSIRR